MYPRYLDLAKTGEIDRRAARGREILASCTLCPRACRIDRLAGEQGYCRSGSLPMVASHNLHHGEEPVISGSRGSGTIFFSNCTLRCVFCQNYPISQLGVGNTISIDDLAGMMLNLQKRGAHNVNLVTPTHYVPQFIEALSIAVEGGFHLPIVYNTNGFDSLDTLSLLDDIVDIYLPDAKYAHDEHAKTCSLTGNYAGHNRSALKEMLRQVGQLEVDEDGIARRGMIIRHLVLPQNLSDTAEVLHWICEELGPQTTVSLMSQYFPAHKALKHPLLGRKITWEEYEAAIEAFEDAQLENGWQQEFDDGY